MKRGSIRQARLAWIAETLRLPFARMRQGIERKRDK